MWRLFWGNSCEGGKWSASSTLSTKLKKKTVLTRDWTFWDTNGLPFGFVNE